MAEQVPENQREGVRVTEVASTPSPFPAVASPETLHQLEFAAALAQVAGRAVSALGAARVQARLPSADPHWVAGQLSDAAELAAVLARDDPFRPEPVADLTETLATLAVPGSVLEAAALVTLGAALAAIRTVARELTRLKDIAPRAAALKADPPPKDLEQAIARALDPDGSVRDDASPELKRARGRVRDARARLVARLEAVLGQIDAADRGSGTVTLREGRYVIPVRRGGPQVSGIVHGASGSGATLFVEPEEVVPLGNELREQEADEARAVLAVLRDLTDRARGAAPRIAAGWEMCIAVDDLYARARYACDVAGALPTVASFPEPRRGIKGLFTAENAERAENGLGRVKHDNLREAPLRPLRSPRLDNHAGPGPIEKPRPALVMRSGRHPLLIAEGAEVVPFDLALTGDQVALVISGPNTGGKTVLLKAVGLMAALAQAGVLPPVGEGSALPVFRRIFADIGDHQSIAASLSTFSGHVAALKGILEAADGASLVLVDEIGNGTDPAEGGALAVAALQALVRRRVTTIVTTHLAQLKDVAARTPGVENASLEFDAATLTPTYRFLQSVPGRSYGLAVARRLGLPADVLAEAEAIMPAAQRTLEALLADLEAKTQEVERRERETEALRARLAAQAEASQARERDVETRERAAAAKERDLERAGREQARQFLLEARRRVEEALALARAAVSEATAREARRLVEEGVQREAEELKKLDHLAKEKGWRVSGLKREGVKREGPTTAASRFTVHASRSEVDLRGQTVDEAIGMLVSALDAAVVNDLPWLRVIHGKGTGALRDAVQRLLKADRRVAAFRLAPPQEGGAGVTLVDLQP